MPSPIVIAHRGASGYRPEHTLAAYALAIEQGADVIEPDLVVTRDGVLIARHENEISGTTDVAAHAEFADRQTGKRIDGVMVHGWFAEDFTLREIKTLRARERLPALRAANTVYDGQFDIPTFAEVIALAQGAVRPVAVYPETKHPTYFAHEGRHHDGTPIHRSLGRLLIDQLVRSGLVHPQQVYIQSFELANLIELKREIMPAAGVDFPLMQLYDDLGGPGELPINQASIPYDIRWHASRGDNLPAIYADLAAQLARGLHADTCYAELATAEVLRWMQRNYAYGIAPWKDNLLARISVPAPDGSTGQKRLCGGVNPLVAAARAAGLHVHTYTLRADAAYLSQAEDGSILSVEQEIIRLLDAGIDGYFTDQPDRGVAARDRWLHAR